MPNLSILEKDDDPGKSTSAKIQFELARSILFYFALLKCSFLPDKLIRNRVKSNLLSFGDDRGLGSFRMVVLLNQYPLTAQPSFCHLRRTSSR